MQMQRHPQPTIGSLALPARAFIEIDRRRGTGARVRRCGWRLRRLRRQQRSQKGDDDRRAGSP